MCIDSYLLTHNPEVVGSNPSPATTSPRTPYRSRRRFFLQNNRHLLLILSRLLPNLKRKASGLFF